MRFFSNLCCTHLCVGFKKIALLSAANLIFTVLLPLNNWINWFTGIAAAVDGAREHCHGHLHAPTVRYVHCGRLRALKRQQWYAFWFYCGCVLCADVICNVWWIGVFSWKNLLIAELTFCTMHIIYCFDNIFVAFCLSRSWWSVEFDGSGTATGRARKTNGNAGTLKKCSFIVQINTTFLSFLWISVILLVI